MADYLTKTINFFLFDLLFFLLKAKEDNSEIWSNNDDDEEVPHYKQDNFFIWVLPVMPSFFSFLAQLGISYVKCKKRTTSKDWNGQT